MTDSNKPDLVVSSDLLPPLDLANDAIGSVDLAIDDERAMTVPPDAPQVGQLAALTIEQCCAAAATRVLAAATEFATLNAQVQEEAGLLAQQIVAEGKRWASFMERSTALARNIHGAMRTERDRIKDFVREGDTNGAA